MGQDRKNRDRARRELALQSSGRGRGRGPGRGRGNNAVVPPPPPLGAADGADNQADENNQPEAEDMPPPAGAADDADNHAEAGDMLNQPPPPPPRASAAAHAGNPANGAPPPPPPPPPPSAPAPTPPPPPQSAAHTEDTPSPPVDNVLTVVDGYFKIDRLSLQVEGGRVLLANTSIELHKGRRYALLGPNASGKSMLLAAIRKTIFIPSDISTCLVAGSLPASDIGVLEAVMGDDYDPKVERDKLKQSIADSKTEEEKEVWRKQLDNIGQKARYQACVILAGFGFDSRMVLSKVESFSATSRLKIALAKAFYMSPDILLLDNPTRHLDFEACAWLEEQLRTYEGVVVIASNCATFMNNICTSVIAIDVQNKVLLDHNNTTYTEYEQNSQGHQGASSRNKSSIQFANVAKGTFKGQTLVRFLNVSLGHSTNNPLFTELSWDIPYGSKFGVIGSNGSGKTTLLKIIAGELHHSSCVFEGRVDYEVDIRIQHFEQHSTKMLDLEMTCIKYIKTYNSSNSVANKDLKTIATSFGLTEKLLSQQIKCLSDGQKAGLILTAKILKKPKLLLLDESTADFDSETVSSLADGLNQWDGAVVIVGHDIRFISMVAKELYVCENQRLKKEATCNIITYRDKVIEKAGNERCSVRVSSSNTGLAPLFSVGSYQTLAIPNIWYSKYIDCQNNSFQEATISLEMFVEKRYMIASVPCNSLEEGFLMIPGELISGKRYEVRTEVSRTIVCSLLKGLWLLDTVHGFCLSEFTRENIHVTPSGQVKFKGVKLLERSDDLVKNNLSSAITIVKDLFSTGKKLPLEIAHLVGLMENKPEKRELFHTHASHVPLSNEGEFYMRLYGCLIFQMKPAIQDKILENLPHLDSFEVDAQSNRLLNQYFQHNGGNNYTTTRVHGQILTAEEERQYKLEVARKLTRYLRNRKGHSMDHFQTLFRYLGDMADLAMHVRFPLINCYLQEQLYDEGAALDLLLHDLIK